MAGGPPIEPAPQEAGLTYRSMSLAVDDLRHRQRTWLGWSTVIYSLRIEEYDEGRVSYDVVEQTESLGEETVVCSEDPDDAACWIEEMLQEAGEEN